MKNKVAISTLNHEINNSPDKMTNFSAEKEPNNVNKKLYEISEIYSTMKIHETPEGANDSQYNQIFPNYIMDCFKPTGEDIKSTKVRLLKSKNPE